MKVFRADPITLLLDRCLSLRITRGVVIRPVVSTLLFPLEMRNSGERGWLILLERLTNYINLDRKKKLRIQKSLKSFRNFWMEERIDIELKFEISVITGRK